MSFFLFLPLFLGIFHFRGAAHSYSPQLQHWAPCSPEAAMFSRLSPFTVVKGGRAGVVSREGPAEALGQAATQRPLSNPNLHTSEKAAMKISLALP